MIRSKVIRTTYQVYYSERFIYELERVLNENTRDLRGTSERVNQVGVWIENLLMFIQRLGNLADMDDYIVYDKCIGFDTNVYDNGVGEILFNVYFDKETHECTIRLLDIVWNYTHKTIYNAMFENKTKKRLTEIIQEHVKKALEEERNRRLEESIGKSLHHIINEYTRKTVRT